MALRPNTSPGSAIFTMSVLPSVAQMEALLLERVEVGPEDLSALALRRSEAVEGHLVGEGHLPAERVLLATTGGSTPPEKTHMSRVEFTLK